jgi:hypothetical protein
VLDRIEGDPYIEDMHDSLLKILPALAGAAVRGGVAVARSPAGRKAVAAGVNIARNKMNQKKEESDKAEQEFQDVEAQAESQETTNEGQPPAPIGGGPRENSGIEGMDNPESGSPTEQPGTSVQGPSMPRITRSWFQDNFGMTSSEMVDILIKGNQHELVQDLMPLIRSERIDIVTQYPAVSESIVDTLPFTDHDYDVLNKHSDKFAIPFRRLVKSWESSAEEEKDELYSMWRNTVDKSLRLSTRERGILADCSLNLLKNGAMNAQTLQTYGVEASTGEISGLIKSHGFLFDIFVAGKGSKNDDRGLFYDVERADVVIKNAGGMIAGLWNSGGNVDFDARGVPRLILPFNSVNANKYSDALCKSLDTSAVESESNFIVITGESAVMKAIDCSEQYLQNEAAFSARALKKAIEGDEVAVRAIAYGMAKPQEQVSLLKKWKMTEEEIKGMI